MKTINILLIIITVSVCLIVAAAVGGILIKAPVNPSPESVQVRLKLIDLIFMLVTILSTSIGALIAIFKMQLDKPKDDDNRKSL